MRFVMVVLVEPFPEPGYQFGDGVLSLGIGVAVLRVRVHVAFERGPQARLHRFAKAFLPSPLLRVTPVLRVVRLAVLQLEFQVFCYPLNMTRNQLLSLIDPESVGNATVGLLVGNEEGFVDDRSDVVAIGHVVSKKPCQDQAGTGFHASDQVGTGLLAWPAIAPS